MSATMGPTDNVSHEERVARMRRPADYPVTLLVFNPLNRRLVRPVSRAGLTPNVISVLSFVLALLCGWAMYASVVGGGLLWAALAIVSALASAQLDALDGDLARYTGTGSPQGAALDMLLDRATEVVFVLAATVGLVHGGAGPDVIWLGLAACVAPLFYFYATDAVVRFVRQAAVHDRRRYSTARASRFGTLRFGLYEPFRIGFPAVVVAGFAVPALWATALAFGTFLVWQGFKAMRRTDA